jgi:hypothetical protein
VAKIFPPASRAQPLEQITFMEDQMNNRNEREAVLVDWQEAIAASREVIKGAAIVDVAADSSGWIDSGVELAPGDAITLLAIGRVKVSDEPEISFAPNVFLWHRIGEGGRIAKFAAPTVTFEAREAGNLMLVAHYPGAWADETGLFDPAWPRGAASGAYRVAVLVWRGSADNGLALFAARDASGLGAKARQKLLAPIHLPRGWRPLWRVGATDIYREKFEATDSARILCRCSGDAGIIKYPVDDVLGATTRLAWRWRMMDLPSKVEEAAAPTHDYLSIAVEFDNGLDLTYMWSAALPVGTMFRCPLPWWDKHETHQVVRSGGAELGRWVGEERSVLADYQAAIGGEPPGRIVGVWLIAVAAFQGGRGECEYQAIRLTGGSTTIEIGP